MGCNQSREIEDPRIVCGGTSITAGGGITILGNDLLVPLENKEKQDSAVIKIDLKRGKYEIVRGFYGKLYQSSISKDDGNNTLSEEKIEL